MRGDDTAAIDGTGVEWETADREGPNETLLSCQCQSPLQYNIALASDRDNRLAPTTISALETKSGSTRALAPDLLRGLLAIIMLFGHTATVLHTWAHGTGRTLEADGHVVKEWAFNTAYVVRTLTHLCASGFTFLLGMGVVYLGQSRRKLGWKSTQLVRYYALRCIVLTAVTVVLGLVTSAGQLWFMNAVLFSLAVDYLLTGLLWLAIDKGAALSMHFFLRARRGRDAAEVDETISRDSNEEHLTQPLLQQRKMTRPADCASYGTCMSWNIHNMLLLILSVVAIFWNIWLSDNDGMCELSITTTTATSPTNPIIRVWFWVIIDVDSHVVSGYPPLAWLSFAILGMLYGRLVTARPWTRKTSVFAHSFSAIFFSFLFVLTRIFEFGNLSTGCLQTPEQDANPSQNPYLISPQSFFYVVKYPPDVAYWTLTMAANLALLAVFDAIPPSITGRFTILLDFGTSALFFYVAHLLLLFGAAPVLIVIFGQKTGIPEPMDPNKTKGTDSLPVYFGVSALMTLVLWPICRWYSTFKSKKRTDSLWRFF
ncbi:hypothetical protein NUW58_g2886 [Xylaria curta]|uniref:Uncharacterized protein n=1 Tax=Xylaria curta TaxID=42375 RepID=A0ACC1PDG7_9PEZI|nr:hypothetical protein NUW58_g2886 [Xylaria curta]